MASFFAKVLPDAQRASKAVGIPVSVILAQWFHESAGGTSRLARLRNNFGGISTGSPTVPSWSKGSGTVARPANEGGYYIVYGSFTDYVSDYIHVMSNKRYDKVRQAGKTAGLNDDFKALGASGYAVSGYGQGGSIQQVVEKYDLQKYDGTTYGVDKEGNVFGVDIVDGKSYIAGTKTKPPVGSTIETTGGIFKIGLDGKGSKVAMHNKKKRK